MESNKHGRARRMESKQNIKINWHYSGERHRNGQSTTFTNLTNYDKLDYGKSTWPTSLTTIPKNGGFWTCVWNTATPHQYCLLFMGVDHWVYSGLFGILQLVLPWRNFPFLIKTCQRLPQLHTLVIIIFFFFLMLLLSCLFGVQPLHDRIVLCCIPLLLFHNKCYF